MVVHQHIGVPACRIPQIFQLLALFIIMQHSLLSGATSRPGCQHRNWMTEKGNSSQEAHPESPVFAHLTT